MEMGRKRTRQKAKSKGAKGLALLMAGLLALGLLAGCGEAAGPAADEPAEQEQQTTTTERVGQSIIGTRVPIADKLFLITPAELQQRLNDYLTEVAALSPEDFPDGPLLLEDAGHYQEETGAFYSYDLSSGGRLTCTLLTEAGDGIAMITLQAPKDLEQKALSNWIFYSLCLGACLDWDYPSDILERLGVGDGQVTSGRAVAANEIVYSYNFDGDKYTLYFFACEGLAEEPGEVLSLGEMELSSGSVALEDSAPATAAPGTEYQLTAGTYVVGEDMQAGKYDVQWLAGAGNCFAGNMIETFGEDSEYYIKEYKNLSLSVGDEVEVTRTLQVKFTAK